MKSKKSLGRVLVLFVAVFLLQGCNWIAKLSLSADGVQTNGDSEFPVVSADGRFVVYQSIADNLVAGDNNGFTDIFLVDVLQGTIEIISRAHDGSQLDGASYYPALSADGRYVTFASYASNMLAVPLGPGGKVVVRDLQLQTNTVVNLTPDGLPGGGSLRHVAISDDGDVAAFMCQSCTLLGTEPIPNWQVYAHVISTGTTTLLSAAPDGTPGNGFNGTGPYSQMQITPDGRYVGFTSISGNIAAGDSNGQGDVILHDRQTGLNALVSVATDGTQGDLYSGFSSMSDDARYIVFESQSTVFAPGDDDFDHDIFIRDRQLGTTELVERIGGGELDSYDAQISADGRYLAYLIERQTFTVGDALDGANVFLLDRQTGIHTPVNRRLPNISQPGIQGEARDMVISDDNRYVVWHDISHNLVAPDFNQRFDIFMRAAIEISVDAVIPSQIPAGATTSITIQGSNFVEGSVPLVVGNGVTVSNITRVDENTFVMDATVAPAAATGLRRVDVWLFGTGAGSGTGSGGHCTDCLTVF